ncbi:coiled-coil domain-containing protein 78 [Sphaeramia orbicularis]|uniref:coiled-coil domain-containing protein 78 n=1 Tax=Sphaeramia orbicularis TaxID=375764 RepID=UPI00117DCB62|nr:coiled-coil domain-containing protein 78 [Sphaeramia orbicularis]
MDSQDQHPSDNPQSRIQALTEENLQLRDKNERLFTKVGYLESRLSHLASSNTDLSCRLVQSEEEKLKISKEFVEEKIQTNKIREQFEEELFELKNKILNQDSIISDLELQRQRLQGELQAAEARLKVGENLTQEYTALKENYRTLTQAHDRELVQSEELGAELLALARAQDALHRQLEEQQHSVKTTTQDLHGELDRVRALISRMSLNRVKPEDLAALDKEQKTMEENLLGNQDEIKNMLEKMKGTYEEQQKKLEEKVVAMGKEHQQNKKEIHDTQQKLSEQSAALMLSQNQVKQLEEDNSKLQLKLKELNEEYRARLLCYLQDLTEYIDGLGETKTPSGGNKMKKFVDNMLQDVRSSYRTREEQLASAARSYKKRLQRVTNTHHTLLIAYRAQREQIVAKPECGLNPGPPEGTFSLDPSELRDETEKELQNLRQDKARLEAQLQEAQDQVAVLKMPVYTLCLEPEQICEESMADISKQLKDITESSLMGFEKERALLITRATVAEAQVSELQDYIDNHLARYKQEINNLHRRHGIEEAQRSQSAHSSLL